MTNISEHVFIQKPTLRVCPSGRCSLLLVLFAGDHVSLSHVERRGVTVSVRRVLEQHRVVVLRLQTQAEVSLRQSEETQTFDTVTMTPSEICDVCESHPVWWRVDEGPVEAGGLGVQGQHQLVFTEQSFRVRLRVRLPLRQRDDPPPAQSVSPENTQTLFRHVYLHSKLLEVLESVIFYDAMTVKKIKTKKKFLNLNEVLHQVQQISR